MKRSHLWYKCILTVIISISTLINTTIAQEMPYNPREVVKLWDYYTLIDKLGEGLPIIDTMAGQAYIAGMQYEEQWFSRKALVSFYFSDIKVSKINLRFWSPYLEQRTGGKISNITDPVIRDSLLREFQIQDSLRMDSVNRILQKDPYLITSMQDHATEINKVAKQLYDLDSLRCDSLIFDMSKVLGPTLRQDTTSHTEIARYSATWIENGFAVSLKDYTDYTDVAFSIPRIREQSAVRFGLDPLHEIQEKLLVKLRGKVLEVSLAVLPLPDKIDEYSGISLMVQNKSQQLNIEKVSEHELITNPRIKVFDFDQDEIPEIWIKFDVGKDSVSRMHKIYSIENEEPIIIFDSQIEIEEGIQIRLLHGFQIELSFADGTQVMFPLEKDLKAIQGKYNSNGVLKKDDLLLPGSIKYLKIVGSSASEIQLEGKIPLLVASNSKSIGDLIVHWKLDSGYWEIIDYHITDQ